MTIANLTEMEMMSKVVSGKDITYLGDAVYASFDGYQIWLSTTNGISIQDEIALEPNVYENLIIYASYINEKYKDKNEN